MPRMIGRMEKTTSQYCHVPHLVCSLPRSDATTPAQSTSCVIAGQRSHTHMHFSHVSTWVAMAISSALPLADVKAADHTPFAQLLLVTQGTRIE